MQIKILGCGGSVGVPSVSCNCAVCRSSDTKNKRLRSSIFIKHQDSCILIDSGPDLRQQSLLNGISYIDGVFYTHIHSDHVAGIHELLAFPPPVNLKKPGLPVYGDRFTLNYLRDNFSYIFAEKEFISKQKFVKFLMPNIVDYYREFYINDTKVLIFPQEHGIITSSGVLVNDSFAYCTDVKKIPNSAVNLLENANLELLIIECIKYESSVSHINFDESVELIRRIKPKRAVFTHMNHDIEYHDLIERIKLNNVDNVEPAYDGMIINV